MGLLNVLCEAEEANSEVNASHTNESFESLSHFRLQYDDNFAE